MTEAEITQLDKLADAVLGDTFIMLGPDDEIRVEPKTKLEEMIMFCTPSRIKKLIRMLRQARKDRDEARDLHYKACMKISEITNELNRMKRDAKKV